MGFAGDLKLRIDLPRTERRLKLLIETDPQRDNTNQLENVPIDVVQEKDYFLSLERQRKRGAWDVRPALGIKAHFPPDPFVRLRAFRYVDLNTWLLHVSGNAFWFNSSGWGMNTSLEFDRALSASFLFRSGTTFSWEEEEKFRRIEQVFTLFQRIGDRVNLAYETGIHFDDEMDWDSNLYYGRVRYRQDIHKNWLFAEIIPQLTYREENNFEDEFSLTFRLEMVFGRRD